jgi:hypothetical protein
MSTPATPAMTVVFRVAAGPRLGYGHLVRATVLGQAMGVPVVVSLRGGIAAKRVAQSRGGVVVDGSPRSVLARLRPDLVVIDDPSGDAAAAWCRAARAAEVPVASVHDIGIGYCCADLTIDGSVTRPGGGLAGTALLGPRYAIVAPRAPGGHRSPQTVLVALGGGPRRAVALTIALAIRRRCPDAAVRIAAGHASASASARESVDGITWLGPQRGLGDELAHATLAVVGGGVTLYEACREATPAVAVAVVAAQRPTIRAFVRAGAALAGGSIASLSQAPALVAALLNDSARQRRVSRHARRLIDGHGASRVATALVKLVHRSNRSRRGGRS